jgi:streptomycin 6-kinase
MNENLLQKLPRRFAKNVLDSCGTPGEEWLIELPRVLGELGEKWSLKIAPPFSNLSYNFVAPCVRADGSQAVLKIALPLDNPEIFHEATFLKALDGRGAVKIFDSDEKRRAILLERSLPGKNLKEVFRNNEAKAVEVAVSAMPRISRRASDVSDFQSLEDWFENFFRKAANTNFPAEYLRKSRRFYEELSSDSKQKFLLHGDLHHENVLSAGREPFLLIDPKGIVGEIGYEIAVFLNNHLWWLNSQPNSREKMNEAVRKFSEAFETEPQDLRRWAFAQMVLSAWWTFEENGETWKRDLAFAEFWEV